MTPIQMIIESKRRQEEDIVALGPVPPWWRPFARRRHRERVAYLIWAHVNDLASMLRSPPDQTRILAHLIGWTTP